MTKIQYDVLTEEKFLGMKSDEVCVRQYFRKMYPNQRLGVCSHFFVVLVYVSEKGSSVQTPFIQFLEPFIYHGSIL